MADVFDQKLSVSYNAITMRHGEKVDVPEDRKFIGFDAYQRAMDCLRPGDVVTVRSAVHDVYEKTGRSGTMTFVVMRLTLTNQRGERVAVVLNRFMHR